MKFFVTSFKRIYLEKWLYTPIYMFSVSFFSEFSFVFFDVARIYSKIFQGEYLGGKVGFDAL